MSEIKEHGSAGPESQDLTNGASHYVGRTIAEQVGDFVSSLSFEEVPRDAVEMAKLCILDAVGIAFASTHYDFAKRALAALSEMETGNYGVIAHSVFLSQRDAALLNGLLIHGLDYDDTHLAGVVHTSASIFPTALAIGIEREASSRDLLLAYILGVEIVSRLGMVAKGGFHQVGFHPTGLVGAFGAAVTAGKIMGLSARELAGAQGIVGSMASGSLEFLETGAWTKRIHPGWAAVSGITAARFAKHGFEAPLSIYEGRFGLYSSHLHPEQERDLSLIAGQLGERWEILNVALKPFPACHFTHAFADAAITVATQYCFDPSEIEEVLCRVPEGIIKTVCEPKDRKSSPSSEYDAKFSLNYVVAASLLKKRFTLTELEDEALSDSVIKELCKKVRYEVDAKSEFPRVYSGEVVVKLRNGQVFEAKEPINRGSVERPLSHDDVINKFRDNVGLVADRTVADRVENVILSIDGDIASQEVMDALIC